MTSIILLGQLVVDPLVWQVPLYGLALIAGIAFVYLIRIHIAVKMAEKRNRSTVGWGLFSFFISPVWAWILLAILGKYVPPDD
ncbi:MAG: hypothetical protein IKN91_09195 [Paludibacteraceae bacterium]|nr:hypothetical protein [Paludibacteraceae bacterium]